MKHDLYIGIDPDIDKSGFAIWDRKDQKLLSVTNDSFFGMVETIHSLRQENDIHITIEAGWLIPKSNWRDDKKLIAKYGAARASKIQQNIAKKVGVNHSPGILLEQMCKRYLIPHRLVKPKGKLDAPTFQMITCWNKRTNQDARDAAMLVFGM